MEEQYIELMSNRSKGLNAYLVKDGDDHTKNMYGKPATEDDQQKAYKSKRHKVKIRIDNLPDGKYKWKEAGGADFNKSCYGWIILENGVIVEESE